MGRPTKLTEETTEIICEALESGANCAVAAAYAGVSESCYHNWTAAGRRGEAPVYVEFLEQTRAARAEAAMRSLKKITNSKDTKDHRWLLSRVYGYVEGGGFAVQQEPPPTEGGIVEYLEYLLRLTINQREQASSDKSHVAASHYLKLELDLRLRVEEARRNEGEDPADLSNEQWAEETAATAAALEMPELEAFVMEYLKRTGAKLEPPE